MHYSLLVTLRPDEDLSDRLEPFYMETDDPRYLEFEEVSQDDYVYYDARRTMVRHPDGTIRYPFVYPFSASYEIVDGKVCSRRAGPLHHPKRTRSSKKYTVLQNFPIKKLYKDFDDFMVRHMGYSIDEEHGAYGSYTNPNGYWDYYDIGGRWPYQFLVKEDVKDALEPFCERQPEDTPTGYRWVPAARVEDIQFDLQKELRRESYTKGYNQLLAWLNGEDLPVDGSLVITAEGLSYHGHLLLLYRGETLEEYLSRNRADEDTPILPKVYATLDRNGQWDSQEIGDEDFGEAWMSHIEEYMRNLKPDDILALIDYHS